MWPKRGAWWHFPLQSPDQGFITFISSFVPAISSTRMWFLAKPHLLILSLLTVHALAFNCSLFRFCNFLSSLIKMPLSCRSSSVVPIVTRRRTVCSLWWLVLIYRRVRGVWGHIHLPGKLISSCCQHLGSPSWYRSVLSSGLGSNHEKVPYNE